MTHPLLRSWLILLVGLSAALSASARGQTIIWVGRGDGTSWNQRANWLPGRLPTSHDDVLIPEGAGTVVVRSGFTPVHSLRCDRDLLVSGGHLAVTESLEQGPASRIAMTGGQLSFGSAEFLGASSFSQSTVTANGRVTFTGRMELHGGMITGAGDIVIAGESLLEIGEVSGAGGLVVPPGSTLRTTGQFDRVILARSTSIQGVLRFGPGSTIALRDGVEMVIEEGGRIDASEGPGYCSIVTIDSSDARVSLRGRIDALPPGGLSCETRFQAAAGSSIVGGLFRNVKSIAGSVESPEGGRVELMGPAATFEPTARLECAAGGSFALTLSPEFPEGLLDHLHGDVGLQTFSYDGVTIPASFSPRRLQLWGGYGMPFRLLSDLTVERLEWWNTPLILGATLTVTGELPAAGPLSGSGRLVLAPSATAPVCPSGPGVTVENYGTVEASGFGVAPGGTVINRPSGTIRVADGADYPVRLEEPGLLINEGLLNFHVRTGGYHPVFSCFLQNEAGGTVVCGPDEPSASYVFLYLPATADGLWACDRACPILFDTRAGGQRVSLEPTCEIRTAGPLRLRGDFVVQSGARVSADLLETSSYGFPTPPTACTLLTIPSIRRLSVLNTLAVEVPWTLPGTYVLGTLSGSADLTVGSTLDLQGNLDGPGELSVPGGATISVLPNYPGQTFSKRVINRGTVNLAARVLLEDAQVVNTTEGTLNLSGELSASGSGGVTNLGTAYLTGYTTAPFDNRGTAIVRNTGAYLGSTPQRVGNTLAGGDWRFGGAGALSWPTGVEIEEIGPGARVTLEPGVSRPSWNFARTLRRIDGELRILEGRSLDLQPAAPRVVSNGGSVSLALGSVLTIAGAYEQTGELAVAWDAEGLQQGRLRAGSARLAGSLRVDSVDAPRCGWTFAPVEAPTVEDRLSVVQGSDLPPGRRWAAFAENGALRAGVFAVADFNADGAVTVEDYMAYVACFVGDECPRPDAADFNGDGFLDILDYDAFVEALEAGGC